MICLLLLVAGYIFGLFQTGFFVSRITGVNLQEKGSGNTGATNALRVMGIDNRPLCREAERAVDRAGIDVDKSEPRRGRLGDGALSRAGRPVDRDGA